MEETTFQFSEPTVVIALVVVMFVLVLRVMTLGESGGPALEKPGRAKLRNVSGGLLGEAPDDIDVDDEEVLELGDDDNNIIYSTKVSTPLLSRLINHEVIARVAYETPGRTSRLCIGVLMTVLLVVGDGDEKAGLCRAISNSSDAAGPLEW